MTRITGAVIFLVAAGSLIAACTRAVRPPVMQDLDALRHSRQLDQAKLKAPQAADEVERLADQAEEAADRGDPVGAELIADRAIAGIHRTVVLARLTRALERRATIEIELADERQHLDEVDRQHAGIAGEIDRLETRARVLRDTIPLTPNVPTEPKQDAARKEAAIALSTQARLLCLAAKLVAGERGAEVQNFEQRLDALDRRLGLDASDRANKSTYVVPIGEPIDEAIALRSNCLSALTQARRPATAEHPEVNEADRLLQELSRGGFAPSRDDRGVIVTLPCVPGLGPSKDSELAKSLKALALVAKGHGEFPVLVVAHSAKPVAEPPGRQALLARAEETKKLLVSQGVLQVERASVGNRIPIALPGTARELRNERLEVVFVAPTN